MDQSTSKRNLLTCALVLILVSLAAGAAFCSTASKASGGGVFDAPEVVEHEGEETATLDFASVGVEKANWGYGQVVDGKFKVFVRDKNVERTWGFSLPEKISAKSNWEIIIQLEKFDFQFIGVAVGGLYKFSSETYHYKPIETDACLLIPINGGRCKVRHLRPKSYKQLYSIRDNRIINHYDIEQSVQKISLPAELRFVYDGLEQQYTVYANDEEIATYCFSVFDNRIPWNITHIALVILTPDRSPVRMELDSKFTVRAW